MIKILRMLKKWWKSVLIVFVLLIVQAIGELTLPDYTSRIVNVGIQQGGVESCASEVIRVDTMNLILMSSDKDDYILSKYTLKGKDDFSESEYKKIKEKYPLIENEKLYFLNDISKDKKEKLENVLAKPLVVSYFLQEPKQSEILKKQLMERIRENGEDPSRLENIDLMTMIKRMPEEEQEFLMISIGDMLDKKIGPMIEQSAISATRFEYESIGMDMNKIQMDFVWKSGFQMLGVALIIMASAVTIMFFSSGIACKLAKYLREEVFKKVVKYSTAEFNEFSTASLITRSTNDIQQIQMMFQMLFRIIVFAPVMGIGGLIRVILKSNTSMIWIIGFSIACILLIMLTLFIVAIPKFKKLQILIDKINLVAREILTGLPVIRAFHKEKEEEERFDKANLDLMKTNLFISEVMAFMMPLLMFIMNGIALMIVWFGSHNIDSGIMQVGDMMAIIQYTMIIVTSFLMISLVSIMIPRAAISANRIMEVLDKDLSIEDKKETKKLDESKKGLVEFKNVSFKYPDADMEVLSDISFVAEPGKTTAIIGSTGSGKSTVVNLIPRFYDVTSGEICVDGVNVKDVSQKDLRGVIGLVPQKGVLFSGTIESNIKFADKNISDEKMYEAARIAQAKDFIEEKPEKYQAPISQGGTNVSGGQKQRISIARAIASDPEIYIFDDSFSALDYKTDAVLREELAKVTKDKTVIIVAQRINTVLNANQIITLEDGKIVGKGTHEELMENCEVYRQIALSQLSEEELSKKKKGSENR